MVNWNDETIKMSNYWWTDDGNDFIYSNCTVEDGETYQDLIEDLILKTKR